MANPAFPRPYGLRQLLNEWDFIGVYDADTNIDEYDCLIGPVLSQLAAGANAIELTAFLTQHIESHFGMQTKSSETATVAARIARWWNAEPLPT